MALQRSPIRQVLYEPVKTTGHEMRSGLGIRTVFVGRRKYRMATRSCIGACALRNEGKHAFDHMQQFEPLKKPQAVGSDVHSFEHAV